MRFHGKRRDANESLIVAALRAVGASVLVLDAKGAPDLIVGWCGRTHLVEIKNPNATGGAKQGGRRTKGRGALTPAQVNAIDSWKGASIHQVVNVDEALRAIGARQ